MKQVVTTSIFDRKWLDMSNLEWILATKHNSAQSGMVSQPKLIVIKEYDHNENAYFCVFSVVSEEKSFTRF